MTDNLVWNLGVLVFLESSFTQHSLATFQVPGTKEHNSAENSTGVEGGKNTSNCDEEWQAMDREVPGAGCSLGRKQRFQWVQRVAFKWSLTQKKCGEYRPSPAVTSGRTKLGSGGTGGAWSWPLPSLPILFLSLLWTPTCTFSSFISYLVVTKTWTKSFPKEKPAKRHFLPLISLCLPLCMFNSQFREGRGLPFKCSSLRMQKGKNHWEGFSNHNHENNGPWKEQGETSQGNICQQKWIPGSSLPGMNDSVEGT